MSKREKWTELASYKMISKYKIQSHFQVNEIGFKRIPYGVRLHDRLFKNINFINSLDEILF